MSSECLTPEPLGRLETLSDEAGFAPDLSEVDAHPDRVLNDFAVWRQIRGLYQSSATGHQSLVLPARKGQEVVLGVVGAWSTSIRDGERDRMGHGPYGYELATIANMNPKIMIVAPQKNGEKGAPNLSDDMREQLWHEGRYVEVGRGLVQAFEIAGQEPTELFGISEGGREVLGIAASGVMKGKLKRIIMVDPPGVEDLGLRGLYQGMNKIESTYRDAVLELDSVDPEHRKIMRDHDSLIRLIGRWVGQHSFKDQAFFRTNAMSKASKDEGLEPDLHEALSQDPNLRVVWVSAEHSAVGNQAKVIEIYSRLPDEYKKRVTLLNAVGATHSLTQAHPHRVGALVGEIASAA